jgi:hypothetical protein
VSKHTEEWSESDDTHDSFGKANASKADEFTSKKGDGGKHCHLWVDKEKGESGVVHREECKVCDDEKTWSDSNSILSNVSRFFGGNG